MDHTLSAKTAKFTSLENLYEYGICVSERLSFIPAAADGVADTERDVCLVSTQR